MVEAAHTLHIFSEFVQASNTGMLQNNLASDTISRHNSATKQAKHRQRKNDKNLLIGGSQYIQPKNNVKLVTSVKAKNNVLQLPVREKKELNTDWITVLFILALILFATVRVSSTSYIRFLFQSVINYTTSFRLFREKKYPIPHGATQLDIIFYFIFSLFIYQVENVLNLEFTSQNILLFLITFGSVLSYFFLKKVLYYAVGLVFESVSETNEYLFNVDIFNRTLGIVLFPIVALINYYPADNPLIMVYAGLLATFVFYILLLQRGANILLKKQFSIFYLFLYLCTLEILPLLLIYKVVVI